MPGNILVTGGAGYIGSHTCKELQKAGFTPIAYDNLSQGHRWAVQWGPLVEGDILDGTLLLQTFKAHSIEAVIHFAALADVAESTKRPDRVYRVNVAGSLALIQAMRVANLNTLVFSSSCATYGHPNVVPLTEAHLQAPANPYGRSKLMVEQLLADYKAALGFKSVCLRYFNAAGADAQGDIGELHAPETHLIPLALAAASGTLAELTVHGTDYSTHDGTCIRDYVHVTDLAAAHVSALQALREDHAAAAYNLGQGEGFSVNEILAAISRITGKRVPRKSGPRRPGDPAALVADISKARQDLGYKPQHSTLDNIIQTAWAWELKKQQELPA
jgi:UDP-arabinose 4-epimerase